jgi:hypothetical protein
MLGLETLVRSSEAHQWWVSVLIVWNIVFYCALRELMIFLGLNNLELKISHTFLHTSVNCPG